MTTIARMSAAFLLALIVGVAGAVQSLAKDYIVTGVKPDKLVVIDAAARKVVNVFRIPKAAPGPVTITPSPDGKIAYVIVNRWESIAGIDLATGKQVFRANLSGGEERVKAMFGMDVTPDGKQIAVYESPVKLMPGEYRVQPTRISFYDTATGKRIRSIPAPRQITIIMFSRDGSELYGMGRALYVIDPANGKITKRHETQKWKRANFAPPDILDVWSQWEQSNVFSTPYYTARTDKKPDDPTAYWTGILTLDLDNGTFKIKDVENTDIFYFSTVVSPANKTHVFGVYNQLAKLDIETGKSIKRVDLDHSYYDINISSDGSEVYVGGTMSDIGVYNADTLKKIGSIKMPRGANMAISSMRIIQR
jgi:quinohemoprotein amine dehydrogenase beta subunit